MTFNVHSFCSQKLIDSKNNDKENEKNLCNFPYTIEIKQLFKEINKTESKINILSGEED